MKIIFYFIIPLLFLTACSDNNTSLAKLEKSVVEHALKEPDTAGSFFMDKIESGASSDEQAVYMYGMGLAHETTGNKDEAINDYLAADGLGNKSAGAALDRLGVKRN